jgi:phosphotransferase system enzyme I (PtsP)
MRVHDTDAFRVDGMVRLVELATSGEPLHETLQAMCKELSLIGHADVVSVYLRERDEGGDRLVLRANVGFPDSAVGRVVLAPGEGIVGTAAEVMRPISTSVAQEDSHYKHFPQIGEEAFPSLVAVPLQCGNCGRGVLVMQRSEAASFSDGEVALAQALAVPFALAIERAEADTPTHARSARLLGTTLVPGNALGRAAMLGTLESMRSAEGEDVGMQPAEAFEAVIEQLRRALRKIDPLLPSQQRRELAFFATLLDDQRLRSLLDKITERFGPLAGLRQLARHYASVSTGPAREPLMEQRAFETENLCLLVATRAMGRPLPGRGSVLVVAERLSAMVALAAVTSGCEGIIAASALDIDELGVAIARAGKVPVIAAVPGLFSWVRPGDTLRLDAEEGSETGAVRVNPPATAIRSYRRESKD